MHCIATLPLVQDFCHHGDPILYEQETSTKTQSPSARLGTDELICKPYHKLRRDLYQLNLTTLDFYNKDQLNLITLHIAL